MLWRLILRRKECATGFPWLIIRAAFEESQPPVDPNSSSQGGGGVT